MSLSFILLILLKTANLTLYPFFQISRLLSNGRHIPHSFYLLRCRDYPTAYVGKCERVLRTRISDNVDAFVNNSFSKLAFAKLFLNENQSGGNDRFSHFEKSFRRILVLESIEITRHLCHHDRLQPQSLDELVDL